MTKAIYKYPLEVLQSQQVNLPERAEILSIQAQGEVFCIWALVDPQEAKKETRIIEIYPTGSRFVYQSPNQRKYISTIQMYGGQLVFHAFELLTNQP